MPNRSIEPVNLKGLPITNPNSIKKAVEFLSLYENSGRTYKNSLKRLFEMLSKDDVADFNYSDYKYVREKSKKTVFAGQNSFFQFLYAYDYLIDDTGFENEGWGTKGIIKSKIGKINKRISKKEYTPALKIADLDKLISFHNNLDILDFKNAKSDFCFYMLYYKGINRDLLMKFDAKNYDNGHIKVGDVSYEIPTQYIPLMENLKSNEEYSGFSSPNPLIKSLGETVGIPNLQPKSISAAREQNSLSCSQCGNVYLLEVSNWVAINNIIICKTCADPLLEKRSIKKNIVLNSINCYEYDFAFNEKRQGFEFIKNTEYNKQDKKTEEDLIEDFKAILGEENIRDEKSMSIIRRYASIVNCTKEKYDHTCQICLEPSFMKDDGKYYCEAHHLIFLSSNGLQFDSKNIIILCAEHHRMFHYASKQIIIGEVADNTRVIMINNEPHTIFYKS